MSTDGPRLAYCGISRVDLQPFGRAKRICFVESAASAFTAHRKHLARAALAAGFEVHVVAPEVTEERPPGLERVVFHELKLNRSGTDPLSELRVIAQLVRHYRRIKPDLVHHIALKPVLYGAIAARLAKVQCVLGTLTGLGYTFLPGGVPRRALKLLVSTALRAALSGSVHTTFENPDDRDFFMGEGLVSAARSSVIVGSGVDTREYTVHPEPPGVPVVLIGARMLWDKGIGELITAARALRAAGVAFKLVFAGAPDPQNPVSIPEQQLREWQTEGVIEWLGMRSDMPALIGECHIACLPSYREGLPVFLAEAAASGRPSVTTDVPGCRTAVLHERTGLLVPVRQSEGLASALRRLIEDGDLRRDMGRQARQFAEAELSSTKVSAEFLALYRHMLERTGAPLTTERDAGTGC